MYFYNQNLKQCSQFGYRKNNNFILHSTARQADDYIIKQPTSDNTQMNSYKPNNKSANKIVYARYLRSLTQSTKDRRSSSLNASKNNSRKNSVMSYSTPKTKSKSVHSKSRYKQDRLLFDAYDQNRNQNKKMKKAVAIIPAAICYKDKPKHNQIKSGKQSMGKSKRSRKYSKLLQNKQNNFNYNIAQQEEMVQNKCLLKTAIKPSKVNFMSRISNIYDLVISKAMLPQFVQYFLGQALFVIHKQEKKSSQNGQGLVYDWRLDEFKKLCEKIYENSQEQDLRLFMGLSLPSVSRWSSKLNSTKNTTFAALQTATNESRVTSNSCNINRIGFFKSLNKRDLPEFHGEQVESIHIIDKLNTKIDDYLKNYSQKIKTNKFQFGNQNILNQSNLPLQIEPKKGRANAILFGDNNR